MHLVEERITYASAVSLKTAMQYSYGAEDDAVVIFARSHDICGTAVALSADIAKVLYPSLYMKPENSDARLAFWRENVLWDDVPYPLMSFLQT